MLDRQRGKNKTDVGAAAPTSEIAHARSSSCGMWQTANQAMEQARIARYLHNRRLFPLGGFGGEPLLHSLLLATSVTQPGWASLYRPPAATSSAPKRAIVKGNFIRRENIPCGEASHVLDCPTGRVVRALTWDAYMRGFDSCFAHHAGE